MPLSADGVAEGMDSSQRVGLDPFAVGEHHTAGAHRGRNDTTADDAVADGAGCLVPSATDHRHPFGEHQFLGGGLDLPAMAAVVDKTLYRQRKLD